MTDERDRKVQKVAGVLKYFVDDTRERMDRLEASLTDARERLARFEGAGKTSNAALETLKAVGPWILALLGLIGALVQYVISKT